MDANTFLGYFVIAAGTVIALFFTLGKPIINLTNCISSLRSDVGYLKEYANSNKQAIETIRNKASESHQRIHDRIDKVEENVDGIDRRVTFLEKGHL